MAATAEHMPPSLRPRSSSKRILLGGWLLEVRKWVDDYAAAKAAASQLTQAGVARGGGRGLEAGAGAFVGAAPPPAPPRGEGPAPPLRCVWLHSALPGVG